MRRIDPKQAEQEQRSQGVITLMIMVMVIFLIQLWLLNIALEEYMAAHSKLAMPTFLASCFCTPDLYPLKLDLHVLSP